MENTAVACDTTVEDAVCVLYSPCVLNVMFTTWKDSVITKYVANLTLSHNIV